MKVPEKVPYQNPDQKIQFLHYKRISKIADNYLLRNF